jgi:hypothetical protein
VFSGERPAQDRHVETRADSEGVGLTLGRIGRRDSASAEKTNKFYFRNMIIEIFINPNIRSQDFEGQALVV